MVTPISGFLAGGLVRRVHCRVGAEEVCVTVQRLAWSAVDQEADLLDTREVGVEGSDDGVEGKGLGLDARGVVVGEGAVEIDDGELAAGSAAARQ